MNSQRIAILFILTICIYALSIFFETGMFLLPLGLYKLGLLLISILFAIIEKKARLKELLLILSMISLAIGSQFVLQFIFPPSDLSKDTYELVKSISLIGFSLIFLAWQINLALPEKSIFRLLQLINAFAMSVCILTNQYTWYLIPTIMWGLSLVTSRSVEEKDKSFAYVYGFMVVSAWVSGVYLGKDAILGNL
jgi:hypothetical protein